MSTVPDPSRGDVDRGDPAALVGLRVGAYVIEGHIGDGAMGVVYKAHDDRLMRTVALKILSERLSPNDRAKGRMLREARAAARLKSRNVVQVLDHGVFRDRPYIVMELLEGETLRDRLTARGRLDPNETSKWISEVANGLEKAHAASIIHRDLKPENVFLAREDGVEVAKILDFGVAKASEAWAEVAATRTGAVLGTPAYMSPEQANGEEALDHRSDLWSLGVIAFECLTGRRPFDREQLGALCVQILSEPLPIPTEVWPEVPAAFDAWWQRAAARDPNERFQGAREMAAALADALRGNGVWGGGPRSGPEAPNVQPGVWGGGPRSGPEAPNVQPGDATKTKTDPPAAITPSSAKRDPRKTGLVLAALGAALGLGLTFVAITRRSSPQTPDPFGATSAAPLSVPEPTSIASVRPAPTAVVPDPSPAESTSSAAGQPTTAPSAAAAISPARTATHAPQNDGGETPPRPGAPRVPAGPGARGSATDPAPHVGSAPATQTSAPPAAPPPAAPPATTPTPAVAPAPPPIPTLDPALLNERN